MQKEAKKHAITNSGQQIADRKRKLYAKRYTLNTNSGFTLVELILVVGTIALIAGALVGLVSNSYEDWKLGSDRSTLLQDGQAVMEQMVRILRQAKAFSAVTQSTDQAGDITFTDVDGVAKQFKLNTQTSELEYGQPGSLSALTGSVSSLTFTCYDINGDVLTGAVSEGTVQSIGIEMILTDGTSSFTLSGRVFCPTDFKRVVINEFMYHPDVGVQDEKHYEWVELYNLGDSAVDLDGWTIWTEKDQHDDTLIADPQFGNGSTTIPAKGYAVITTEDTEVYTELITNGGFESGNLNPWEADNWDKIKDQVNAHGGKQYLICVDAGVGWVYQDISIPSGFNSCLFLFWERTTASVAQTQMTVTIRNLSDQVLATGYSGQMSSNWTCHTMDLTAYANQNIRVHFGTNKATSEGALLLDDVSVASSYVDINAVRLSVDDDKIGNELKNNGDTVAITDGSATIDSVTYNSDWGGDGDGTSLARIDPQGSSNDENNWQNGPQNGTPGSAN